MTNTLENKTCPKLPDENEAIIRELYAAWEVKPERMDIAVEMLEELRQSAYRLGYQWGHYNALEESLP